MSMQSKTQELEKVNKEIEKCTICPIGKIGKVVVGEGSVDAKIVFIGEAPGKKEAAEGRPFIGRSGQLLRKLIRESGLAEKDVYITSPVKYLPLRGTPTAPDIAHGALHLQKQLAVIQPRLIVVLGATAAKALLKEKIAVMKQHGSILEENGYRYYITLHPAAALRFSKLKSILENDFKKIPHLLSQ